MAGITRRRFVQGSAAAGSAALGYQFLFGSGETVVRAGQAPGTEAGATEAIDTVNTACWIGKQECGVVASRAQGRVFRLEGLVDNPRNQGKLCPKGNAQIATLYDTQRVTTPLIRTNAKGVTGKWRPASWDDATTLVAQKLTEARDKDPRLAGWVDGRIKVKKIYEEAWLEAVGIKNKYGRRGNDCGGPVEDAVLATWGERSVLSPDLRHCNYLICYWSLTTSGGPGLCQITLPQEVRDARARGMKVVSINPYNRPVAYFADEWVPIKPGTDLAFWLAVLNVLLAEGFIDERYLRDFTSAGSLVRSDGTLLRDSTGAELVWDTSAGAPSPQAAGVPAALLGQFDADGETVKPALQVLKDQVAANTPEWAQQVCGVPADQIRTVALALGRNAMIGSTTVIDGVEVPLRPVAVGIHGTSIKMHSALQAGRAILLTFMILGALESAGGPQLWEKKLETKPQEAHKKWVANAAKEKPDRWDLGDTKWFPLGSAGYHVMPLTVNDPAKYGIDFKPEDMALLVHFLNPVLTARPVKKAIEAWQRFGFTAVVTPHMSATANLTADVVLPCGTLDKWEGPLGAKTLYTKADTVRVPLMEAMGESRSEIDIYVDLANKMGKLGGPDGFIAQLNKKLEITPENALPLDGKPTAEEIIGAWSLSKPKMPLDELVKKGVVTKPIPAKDIYMTVGSPPFPLTDKKTGQKTGEGIRAAFYIEAFRQIAAEQKARGLPEDTWSRFTPFPTWTPMTMDESPREYDLYLQDFKRIEHKHTRTEWDPLLAELSPENPLVMNATTAKHKGLANGDQVIVESINPLTGETGKVQTKLVTTEGIRPDTVGLTHHVDSPEKPTVNALFFHDTGFWDIGGGLFSHVKVKVRKA